MTRFDLETLADHLDAVLMCSPRSTIMALSNSDVSDRHRATRDLACRLAERVERLGLTSAAMASQSPRLLD